MSESHWSITGIDPLQCQNHNKLVVSAIMANPRKFSEKIALHNQKQAEETAAFQAILRDVSVAKQTTSHFRSQNQQLQLQQNLNTPYRAGSLPNVNQMVGVGVDLQVLQQPFEHDIRNQRIDRMANRQGRAPGPQRKAFPIDKQRTDCSPYAAFLSPPPDTSWRRTAFRHLNGANLSRTNSDSAIHVNANTNLSGELDVIGSPTTPPAHRRVLQVAGEEHGDGLMKGLYDLKKLAQSRPKSCEVPNINIYPSTEQENQANIHMPIPSNTGSLPDLTVLQFPSPLSTPLDTEDQTYNGGSGHANLSPTSMHHMGMAQGNAQTQSPGQRRRGPHSGPSPLVLGSSPSQQMRMSHSPPVSVQNIDPSKLPMEPRLQQQYLLYMRQQQQQRQRQPLNNHHPSPQLPGANHAAPAIPLQGANNSIGGANSGHHVPQPSLTQYRNSVSESNCQSPTSPLSQTSHSPAQSPCLPPTSWNNSPFAENYQQQQQQHQTNSLEHQFQQFNMSQDNHFMSSSSDGMVNGASASAIYTSPQNSLNMSQALLHGLSGSNQDLQHQHYYSQQPVDGVQNRLVNAQSSALHLQQQQQHGHPQPPCSQQSPHHQSSNNKIPDIIFTGADDSCSKDFAKDIGNAITGMDSFDFDDALKADLDPLDLAGLQMLTDPSMITDPATEESFKLDRL